LVNVQFNVKVPDNFDNLADNLSGISGKIFATTVSFFSGIISMVIVFALVFYMTVREDGIKNFIVAVVPKKYEGYTISLVVRIKNKIGKWMQGQIVVMAGYLCFGLYLALSFGNSLCFYFGPSSPEFMESFLFLDR